MYCVVVLNVSCMVVVLNTGLMYQLLLEHI